MVEATLFRALGDPTRLEMIRRLSSGGTYTIASLTRDLPITRQGARKHLQLLADANVVSLAPRGRDTSVQLERAALEQGRAFIAKLELQWDARLEALKRVVEKG